jgi:hypothetical protein
VGVFNRRRSYTMIFIVVVSSPYMEFAYGCYDRYCDAWKVIDRIKHIPQRQWRYRIDEEQKISDEES